MSPSVVTVRGDRAIATTGCSMHGITQLDGIDVSLASFTRLLWRARRSGDSWLIAGMRSYYIFDDLRPTRPDVAIEIDEALFNSLRKPYRWIAYTNARAGRKIPDNLVGVDRPKDVEALLRAEQAWLSAS